MRLTALKEVVATSVGFAVGVVFALGVALGFKLPIWPWCLLVLPAQMVVQLSVSISCALLLDGWDGFE